MFAYSIFYVWFIIYVKHTYIWSLPCIINMRGSIFPPNLGNGIHQSTSLATSQLLSASTTNIPQWVSAWIKEWVPWQVSSGELFSSRHSLWKPQMSISSLSLSSSFYRALPHVCDVPASARSCLFLCPLVVLCLCVFLNVRKWVASLEDGFFLSLCSSANPVVWHSYLHPVRLSTFSLPFAVVIWKLPNSLLGDLSFFRDYLRGGDERWTLWSLGQLRTLSL